MAPELYQRAPYPNATFPNPNPFAVKMYSFYPLPNRTPDDVYNANNYASSVVNTVRRHTLMNRVDYRLGRHSPFWRGGLNFSATVFPPRLCQKALINVCCRCH